MLALGKGEMKRKGFAAKEFFRNFAEKWRYDEAIVITS